MQREAAIAHIGLKKDKINNKKRRKKEYLFHITLSRFISYLQIIRYRIYISKKQIIFLSLKDL